MFGRKGTSSTSEPESFAMLQVFLKVACLHYPALSRNQKDKGSHLVEAIEAGDKNMPHERTTIHAFHINSDLLTPSKYFFGSTLQLVLAKRGDPIC